MPDTSPIDAHERAIGRIFNDDYAFEIPPYQRPYAWEEEQVAELLADLIDAMDKRGASGEVYFLGSIVLIKKPGAAEAKVVDGQQRLTTLTILLAVLRDLTTDTERRIKRQDYIHQTADPDRGAEERSRLLLRQQDRDFFLQRVQRSGSTDAVSSDAHLSGSRLRVAENTRYFRDELGKLSEARRDQLVSFVIQHCYLVVVAVPTPEAARRIFTVLNARGMDLTATDILKAGLLEQAPSAEQALAARWEAVELAHGRDRFVELFGHIRMIHERDKPRSALEAAFARVVPLFNQDGPAFVERVLEPLSDALELLSNVQRVRDRFGPEAADAVASLDRIDNKDWIAPALLRLWKRQDGDDAAVGCFLVDLERLAYFLFVTRADVNTRIARFAGVMDEFDPRPDFKRPEGWVSPGGLELSPAEQIAFVQHLDGPLYRKSRVCKPVLQRLDNALSSGGATYDVIVSIEHVLPQTVDSGSEWDTLFPDLEERANWTHRLANLVFLTRRINVKASNWDMDRKKKAYFTSDDGTSPFPLTQGVLRASAWTPDHLQKRQIELIDKLKKVWRLDVPERGASQPA